jgi:hypothetical protein
MNSRDIQGCWRLVSGELRAPEGEVVADATDGLLVYTADGRVAAQVAMAPRGPGNEVAGVIGPYVAYLGTFEVDAAGGVIHHHIEACNVPSYVGRTLPRRAEREGNRLVLVPDLADQADVERGTTGRIVWERID